MSSGAQEITVPGTPQVHEVADNLFAYIQPDGSWWINNTGFLVGPQGVVSIDACATERRTRAYLDAISAVTQKPVRTLVNTHHHGDHTFGNHLFSTATIVAHERTRQELLDFGGPPVTMPYWEPVDWGDIALDPPFLTYTDEVALHLGDLRCEVRYVGSPAHTTNDSIVWIPESSVLFCGDLIFNGGTPFLLMGSIAGAIDVLKNVLRPLGAATIVPGHGPLCDAAMIDTTLSYLHFLQETAEAGKNARRSPLEQALVTDLGPFAGWRDTERIVGNLHRAYAELDGADRGARVDVRAALVDMVAYNGGQPLTCLA